MGATAHNNLDIWAGLGVAGSNTVGLTVMRTLVLIHTQNNAAVGDKLRAGLIIDDKNQVGTTVDMASNANLDWYFWTVFYAVNSGSAAVNAAEVWPSSGMPFDIRARRLSRDMGRTSMLCLTNASAASLTVDVFVRQLVALP